MRMKGLLAGLALTALAGAARAQTPDATLVARGHALAVAADCAACHTAPDGGKPFAGGYGIQSPMGAIFSSNITPSRSAGIGTYTEAQFARALRQGVRADGANLYPAMPYTSYTKLNDADVHALYTYLMTQVAPVDEKAPATQLPFPFNIRMSMSFWNALFLSDHRFQPDPSKSDAYNHGSYLAEVLEHCSVCHTPRNALMAEEASRNLSGAPLGSWYAPNITLDKTSGIGAWTDQELVTYLKTGRVVGKAQAAGDMGEAVTHSLEYLPEPDLRDIVVYLHAQPAIHTASAGAPAFAQGHPADFEPALRGIARQDTSAMPVGGVALFSAYCASCHQPNGGGTRDQAYPSLFHNTATGSGHADNLVSAILFGVGRTVSGHHVLMPRFDNASYVQPLTDDQVAEISNYVLQTFGNSELHVTAYDVLRARRGGEVPLLGQLPGYIPALVPLGLAVLLVIAGFATGLIRVRARQA